MLVLERIVLKHQTGAGALARPILVALDLLPQRQEGGDRLSPGDCRERRRTGPSLVIGSAVARPAGAWREMGGGEPPEVDGGRGQVAFQIRRKRSTPQRR